MNAKFLQVAAVLLVAASAEAMESNEARLDLRSSSAARLATGIELRGSPDGGTAVPWDTASAADGWTNIVSGTSKTNVLVLNGPAVEGGRLSEDTVWGADCVHVVRDDVVVPEGRALSIAADTVVKFTAGARIVAEGDGRVVADGALFADFGDDTVGGDTNFDGDGTGPSTEWTEWTGGVSTGTLVRVDLFDGGKPAFPSRTYSRGRPLGTLPRPERDGMGFDGWWTAASGGTKAEAATAADGTGGALHARWSAWALEVSAPTGTVAAAGGTFRASVAANVAWTASAGGAAWVKIKPKAGDGNGTVRYTVAANPGTAERSATLSVEGGGMVRSWTVTQAGREAVAKPVIVPADGTTFNGGARRVAISCATEGAVIRYTTSGKEPGETDPAYPGVSFNVFETTTVKARAFKDGWVPSGVASARMVRLQTLAEAMGVPSWKVETGGDAGWAVDAAEGREGGSSARSGAVGASQTSVLESSVEGSGVLSFQWKTSCEDDPDNDNWDYLAFFADGTERARRDGTGDWTAVSVRLGEGPHSLRWEYRKDEMDDAGKTGEDCGWVDAVSWTPLATAEAGGVPVAWIENLGLGSAAPESAAAVAAEDPDGDGMSTAEEYVAGTDPTDAASVFTSRLAVQDGVPTVSWTPDLGGERRYRVWAKRDMTEERWTNVTDIAEPGAEGWRFFAVGVEAGE